MKLIRIPTSWLARTLLATGLLVMAGGAVAGIHNPSDCQSNEFQLFIARSAAIFHEGQTVTYTVRAGNPLVADGCDLASVVITANDPSGTQRLNQSVGLVPSGSSIVTIGTFDYTLGSGDIGSITATANATGILHSGHDDAMDLDKEISVKVLRPAIDVTKECVDTAGPGEPILFSGTITNPISAETPLFNLRCVDDPAAPVNIVYPGTEGELEPGETATYSGQYTPTGHGDFEDIMTCWGSDELGLEISDNDNAICRVPNPSFEVAKSCISGPVAVGTNAEWQVVITNTGDTAITASVNDALLPSMNGDYAIPANGNKTLTATHLMTIDNYPSLLNTVSVAAIADTGYELGVKSAEAACGVVPVPAITVTKECIDAAGPGEPILFSGTITNAGDEPVTVTGCTDDPAADGGITVVTAALGVDESTTYSGQFIPAGGAGTYTDTVTCNATGDLTGGAASNTDSAECSVPNPGFEVAKSCISGPVAVGTNAEWQVVITNTGDTAITASVNDALLPSMNGDYAIPANGNKTLTATHLMTIDNYPSLLNEVHVAAIADTGYDLGVKSDEAACGVVPVPAITVTKECTDAAGPGEPILFSGTITNAGDEPVTVTGCTDDPAADGGITVVTAALGVDESTTYSGQFIPAGGAGTYTDTVTCNATGDLTGGAASNTDSAECSVPNPGFEVAKSCISGPVAVGTNAEWQVVITNTGDTAITASVNDALLPSMNGDYAIPANGNKTLTATHLMTIDNYPSLLNTVSVAAIAETGYDLGVKSDEAACGVVPVPAITVTKECTDAAGPGEPILFSGTITNAGDEPVTVTGCTDDPAADGGITVVTAALGVDESTTYSGQFIPAGGAGTYTDTVTCNATGDLTGGAASNTDSAECSVPNPGFEVAKSCISGPVAVGTNAEWQVVITNTGDTAITASVNDALLPSMNGDYAIPANGNKTLTATHLMTIDNYPSLLNTVSVAAIADTGYDLGVKSDEAACGVVPVPAITVTKECTDAAGPGEPILFSGTITNAGDEPVTVTGCTDDPAADGGITVVTAALGVDESTTYSGQFIPAGGAGTYTDTVTCNATGDLTGGAASNTDSAECSVPSADFTVDKECSPLDIDEGDPITWTICATNTGEVDLDITLVDPIAGVDETLLGVVPGEERCVDPAPSRATTEADGAEITNTVTATAVTAGGYALGPLTDTATCNVIPPEEGCVTRTGGYWGTHPEVIVANDFLLPDGLSSCGVALTSVEPGDADVGPEFASTTEDICFSGRDFKAANTSPQQAQLIRQCTVAALNIAATDLGDGSCDSVEMPNGERFVDVYTACCTGTDTSTGVCTAGLEGSDISSSGCIELIDWFNNSEDTMEQTWMSQPANTDACKEANGNSWMNPRPFLQP